ncbi:MAG: radical SAM protein [Magnetococcus sp. WYHC-3]
MDGKRQGGLSKSLELDGHKLAWHSDRVKRWLAGDLIPPITIDCSLTRKCTYKCLYCYGTLQANDELKMTPDVINRFLDDAAEIGVKGISFVSDGESTCHPYLYKAILRGKKNGLDMALGTNGFLLRHDRLEEILPALTYLRFNISAGEPEAYAHIHGCRKDCFKKVIGSIRRCVDIKKEQGLSVTIGTQMVLLPEYADQILPLAELSKSLGVDYFVIKHCSDDEDGALGVNYDKYFYLTHLFKAAEMLSDESFTVKAKWSKLLSKGQRSYERCYGPAFIMQFSGSGLVAPCGMLFNRKYNKYHIGNIAEQGLKKIWQGERYREVLKELASDRFNAKTMCGSLCLQHKCNEYLDCIKKGGEILIRTDEKQHQNFV